jgi:hypothetical protein
MRKLAYRSKTLWILSILIGFPAVGRTASISGFSVSPIADQAAILVKAGNLLDCDLLRSHQLPKTNNSIGFSVLNSAVGYPGEDERDVAMDFTVVQTTLALVHTCLVPLKFGVEKGGLFEENWEVIVPVCAADVLAGLLGGHVGGMVCRAWMDEDEEDVRTFFKALTCGLFSGAIWGSITATGWGMASREHSDDHAEYDIYMYATVAGTVLLGSALHGVVVIFLK